MISYLSLIVIPVGPVPGPRVRVGDVPDLFQCIPQGTHLVQLNTFHYRDHQILIMLCLLHMKILILADIDNLNLEDQFDRRQSTTITNLL
jgi:hypothetical protein